MGLPREKVWGWLPTDCPSSPRLYHTMRFLTVLGLVWPRAIPGPFTGHWKMAVSVIRFLPYHVMRRLTFHCVAQQKPHNAFFPCFSPGVPSRHGILSTAIGGEVRPILPDGKTGHGTSGAADESTRDRPRRLRMQTAPLLASRLSPPARAPLRITPFSAPRRRRSRRPHLLWMTRRVCG